MNFIVMDEDTCMVDIIILTYSFEFVNNQKSISLLYFLISLFLLFYILNYLQSS